jgi:hypothetical protein
VLGGIQEPMVIGLYGNSTLKKKSLKIWQTLGFFFPRKSFVQITTSFYFVAKSQNFITKKIKIKIKIKIGK